MKTIKKAVLLNYLVNEYGLECPVPLEFWPEGAKYSIANDAGLFFCWSEVEYDDYKGCWFSSKIYDLQPSTMKHNFTPEQYMYTVWFRSDN